MTLIYQKVFIFLILNKFIRLLMNWSTAITNYKNYLKIERSLSSNSIENYEYDIQRFLKYLKHKKIKISPIDVNSDLIKSFIYDISKKVSTRTQSRIISGLKSFFKYLVFEDYLETNPVELIDSPKIGRKLPDTLTTNEIDQLISSIDLSHPQGERNRCIIETLYSCGLRVSELVNLKISDFFFEEGFIKVTGKGNKQRFVPIDPNTQKYINLYINSIRNKIDVKNEFSDILFLNRRGKQLTRAMIFTIVKQLTEKSGLQKKISPHTFRHSFATHLLQNGADLRSIQLMLGHESITTTEIYVHLDRSHLKSIIEKYHPRR